MMRVFVYEHLSGGGSADAPDELLDAGREMRDAVARDLLQAGDCAVSVAVGPRSLMLPAGARAVPVPAGSSATDFVAHQAALHDRAWVIAPETGGVLAQLQRAVDAERWLGCDAEAIALTSSKSATLAHAAAHGLTTALAFTQSPATCRWVVKPDDGAGAIGTRVHDTHAAACADLQQRRERREAAVLEAWVVGEALSLSLLCSAGGTELLSVNRQQLTIDAFGMLSFSGVQSNVLAHADARFATLRAWAQTLAQAFAGMRGYVGVDLVWHPQRGPVLIEINPRVTMAYVGLSAALGRNLAALVLASHHSEAADASV